MVEKRDVNNRLIHGIPNTADLGPIVRHRCRSSYGKYIRINGADEAKSTDILAVHISVQDSQQDEHLLNLVVLLPRKVHGGVLAVMMKGARRLSRHKSHCLSVVEVVFYAQSVDDLSGVLARKLGTNQKLLVGIVIQ
jgi:hypothetical protein